MKSCELSFHLPTVYVHLFKLNPNESHPAGYLCLNSHLVALSSFWFMKRWEDTCAPIVACIDDYRLRLHIPALPRRPMHGNEAESVDIDRVCVPHDSGSQASTFLCLFFIYFFGVGGREKRKKCFSKLDCSRTCVLYPEHTKKRW